MFALFHITSYSQVLTAGVLDGGCMGVGRTEGVGKNGVLDFVCVPRGGELLAGWQFGEGCGASHARGQGEEEKAREAEEIKVFVE